MEQLLWSKNGLSFDEGTLSNKPSWSWTTTEGAKSWPIELSLDDPVNPFETVLKDLRINSQGQLQVFGLLSTVKLPPTYVRDEYTARDLQISNEQQLYPLWREHYNMYSYVLTQDMNDGYDRMNLGSACFDSDSITSYSHACFLGKERPGRISAMFAGKRPSVKREFIVRIPSLTTAR